MSSATPASSPTAADRKRTLRRVLRALRQTRAQHPEPEAATQLETRLLQLAAEVDATTISCYLPSPFEPPTRAFVETAIARGIRVLLPIIAPGDQLQWADASAARSLPGIAVIPERTTPFGVPEIDAEPLLGTTLSAVDLVIAPALAASPQGGRLGQGRGFYDRALRDVRDEVPIAAVIFDEELLEEVPLEAHDRPITHVVTPSHTFVV